MTDCEVKEYGNFTAVDDVKVNGKLTLGENTADNGGLRLAYLASSRTRSGKASISTQSRTDTRRSSSSSWLSARTGAASIRPEQTRLQVQTDPHSPRNFRIEGVIQNMPEFGKAFG